MKILSIALANAVILLSGIAAEFLSGVLLSIGSVSAADPRCADILVGVGGWVGSWVARLDFTELSSRVKSNLLIESYGLNIDS